MSPVPGIARSRPNDLWTRALLFQVLLLETFIVWTIITVPAVPVSHSCFRRSDTERTWLLLCRSQALI
jgi:hypothetical protein